MTGSEFKERRSKIGSQEKVARILDVSNSTVARWEQLKDEEIPNSKMLHLAMLAIEHKLD